MNYKKIERPIALWKRFHYLLQTIIIREEIIGDQDVIEKYNQLKACESHPFF